MFQQSQPSSLLDSFIHQQQLHHCGRNPEISFTFGHSFTKHHVQMMLQNSYVSFQRQAKTFACESLITA